MLDNPIVIVGDMLNYYMSQGFSILIEDSNINVVHRARGCTKLNEVYNGDNFADAVTAMDLYLEGLESEIGKRMG